LTVNSPSGASVDCSHEEERRRGTEGGSHARRQGVRPAATGDTDAARAQPGRGRRATAPDEILSAKAPPDDGYGVDRRFLRRLRKIDRLSDHDKQLLLGTIDAFLAKVS
jgi:hypothetical protein